MNKSRKYADIVVILILCIVIVSISVNRDKIINENIKLKKEVIQQDSIIELQLINLDLKNNYIKIIEQNQF